jgi:predicted O-methyltransferase YrrM
MDLHALRASARGKFQRAIREVLDQHASEQEERELRRNEGLVRELDLVRAEVAALGSALSLDAASLHADLATIRTESAARGSALTEFEVRARRDLHFAAEVSAAAESAAFVKAHLPEAPTFPHPDETLRHAAGLVAVPGLALEFGVGGGHTLRLMAEALPGRRVVGFDVFTGLPENWRTGFPAGAFAQEELPEVAGAELVVGLFDETLPGFLEDNDEPVAFLHLDADLYSSTKTVLDLLGHRLVVGSVVLFDEYFNYPGWQQGEHRAWQEYLQTSGLTFRYEGYTYNHEQLIVVVTGQPSPAAAASSTSTFPA